VAGLQAAAVAVVVMALLMALAVRVVEALVLHQLALVAPQTLVVAAAVVVVVQTEYGPEALAAPASSSSATQDLLALLGVQFRKQADTQFTPSQPAEHLRSSR